MHACACLPLQGPLARKLMLATACAACWATLAAQAPVPAAQTATSPSQTAGQKPAEAASEPRVAAITVEELRRQLLGKTFYLRGGYLGDTLHFDENGRIEDAAPQASFTLSLVKITRVHLGKHHLDLEGVRYGLHFLGALPSEDQSTAFDEVRLNPKKKTLRMTIDREAVEKPKKEKSGKKDKSKPVAPATQPPEIASASSAANQQEHKGSAATSTEDANRALRAALDGVLASEVDQRMIASLPEYWQVYYKAFDAHSDHRPTDPTVLRQNQVDRKAKLHTAFEPPSNDYAQKNGVVGPAIYHVVVGADGKPQQIAVARPIGFGLDENAVAAIRKATFEPAMKDGKAVPVLVDLLVEFRINSKRTAVAASQAAQPAQPSAPILPGPYSVEHPKGP